MRKMRYERRDYGEMDIVREYGEKRSDRKKRGQLVQRERREMV